MKGLLITALLSMFALIGCSDNVASANYYDEFQETYNFQARHIGT